MLEMVERINRFNNSTGISPDFFAFSRPLSVETEDEVGVEAWAKGGAPDENESLVEVEGNEDCVDSYHLKK